MCGRYYRTSDAQGLADTFRAELTGDPLAYAVGYNIAPSTTQPVLRQAKDTYSRELVPMRWGLVGFFSKGIDPSRRTFNARTDRLEQSALWNRPLHRHRCIVPMNGFYEWRETDKVAFRFTLEDQPLFGLAGLWDAWKAPDGNWLQSFALIITEPNSLMMRYHKRMPVILRPKDYDEWLNREEVERPPVHLLRPFDGNTIRVHTANPKVGNYRNQGPEMLNA